MQVIICGAGQVGSTIAKYLASEKNDVTVIDQDAELISKLDGTLDVKPMLGHASHPNVLERAGAENADMLIAVTQSDEVNMVACQVAHSLFNVTTKIARIRSQDYLLPIWSNLYTKDNMPIDVIISPEIMMANAVIKRLQIPGTLDVISMANDRIRLIGVRCTDKCPIISTPLRQISALFPDLNMTIVGIVRDEQAILPTLDDQVMAGDDVYFVVDTKQIDRALAAFGHEEKKAKRVLIFGGGKIGLSIAKQLEKEHDYINAKIIEDDKQQAEIMAGELKNTVVLNGNVLDVGVLEEAGIDTVDAIIGVTNNDETSILSAMLAKKYGVRRAIILVNNPAYDSLVRNLGVDAVINPRAITVSTILQHIRRGRIHSAHSLHEDFGELIEIDALETSPLIGKTLEEAELPSGVLIGAILRDEQFIIPYSYTVVEAGDRVVLFATSNAIKKVEKLFSVGLEYF